MAKKTLGVPIPFSFSRLVLRATSPANHEPEGRQMALYSPQKHGNLLTPEQAAKTLGKSTATLATWRCHRQGPDFIKSRGRIFYPEVLLTRWLEKQQTLISCGE